MTLTAPMARVVAYARGANHSASSSASLYPAATAPPCLCRAATTLSPHAGADGHDVHAAMVRRRAQPRLLEL